MPKQSQGCLLGFLFNLLGKKPAATTDAPPPTMINKFFITQAEQAFFHVLTLAATGRAHILCQVSLKQLLYLPGNNSNTPNRSAWQNRINQKSIDFLLLHPKTLRPLLAVELDDASHSRPDRQTRDTQVAALLTAANLPLLSIPCMRTYNMNDLSAKLAPHLGN